VSVRLAAIEAATTQITKSWETGAYLKPEVSIAEMDEASFARS
jgi:hypothetical protein